MTITLYDIHLSPHARKVRLLAAELDIPLNKVTRDPRTGETRTPEYLAKNPNGRVPTLEEDGFVLWESPAILKYLAAKRPERALCGADPKTQALVDQWMCWLDRRSGSCDGYACLGADHQAQSIQSAWQRPGHHRRRVSADRAVSSGARQAA